MHSAPFAFWRIASVADSRRTEAPRPSARTPEGRFARILQRNMVYARANQHRCIVWTLPRVT